MNEKKESITEKGYPLTIVFYLNRGLMEEKDIMIPFSKHIQSVLEQRDANAIALFMPTDGEERIECINPVIATEEQLERVEVLIQNLEKLSDINQGADEEIKEDE